MSNETVPIREVYSTDNIVIGSLYFFTPIIILIFYVPCMVVLFTDPELKNLSCLRIMTHMGVTDVIHVLGFMACGFWELTGLVNQVPYWLNRYTITFTIIPGWWNYIFLANLLGFNRCLARISPVYEQKIFSPKATTMWLSVVWLSTGVWIVFFCQPQVGWLYHPSIFCHFYDTTLPWFVYAERASFVNCVIHTSMTTMWYTIIVIATCFEVHGLSSVPDELRARERNLLLQSVTICLVLAVADQYWHNGVNIAITIFGTYAFVIGNTLLILTSGCNPFVYLALNKTLRAKVKKLLFKQNSVEQSVAFSKRSKTAATKRSAAAPMNVEEVI